MNTENSIPSQANPPIQQTQPAQNTIIQPAKAPLIPLIIAGSILVILIGIIGGYYLGNKSRNSRRSPL